MNDQDIIAPAGINSFASSDDQLITLTIGQLRSLIDERVRHLEENQLILLRLIKGKQRPKQQKQAEILRGLLTRRGGSMPAKEARQIMDLSESRFSELLATMDEIEKRRSQLNGRQNIIILRG